MSVTSDIFSVDSMRGSELPRPPGRPNFVHLAPGDRGEGLLPVFFENPRTFKPKPGPTGQIHCWGIYPYGGTPEPELAHIPDVDGMTIMQRQMNTQMIYLGPANLRRPEDQWTDAIMERKRKQLADLDLKGLDKRDVILKITLDCMKDRKGNPRIWRRFRVSAGIKLSAFQDKAIAPVLGWVRNLHCYTFTDFRDGSLYGPEGCNSVDVVHISLNGYQYLPDDQFMLAHLFAKEGDKIGYLYDFGDRWYHEIEIEQILPMEASDGSIKIIDGKGMCPGENMNGCPEYADLLNEIEDAPYTEKQEKKRKILDCPNYRDFQKPASLFDPFFFDFNAANDRLVAALASTNSVRSGARSFNMTLPGMQDEETSKKFMEKNLKPKQTITRERDPITPHGYWQETTATGKDRRGTTVCGSCGKPGGPELKTCSGCRQILYCSPEHQKAHWKSVHKNQCSRKYIKKA